MTGFARWVTNWSNRLASGFPGTMTRPFSPPFNTPSAVRRSRPLVRATPWQPRQFWRRMAKACSETGLVERPSRASTLLTGLSEVASTARPMKMMMTPEVSLRSARFGIGAILFIFRFNYRFDFRFIFRLGTGQTTLPLNRGSAGTKPIRTGPNRPKPAQTNPNRPKTKSKLIRILINETGSMSDKSRKKIIYRRVEFNAAGLKTSSLIAISGAVRNFVPTHQYPVGRLLIFPPPLPRLYSLVQKPGV